MESLLRLEKSAPNGEGGMKRNIIAKFDFGYQIIGNKRMYGFLICSKMAEERRGVAS